MQIVIQTQYRENYGAHDWNGEGECPQYWKNKGGSTYVVKGVSPLQYAEFQAIVERAVKHFGCSYSNDYSEEYVIEWGAYEDGESIWEEWESPYVKRVNLSQI